MSKINADSNHSSMYRRTYKKKIGNTTYIVKSLFKTSGLTITECIKAEAKFKIGEKRKHEKDTNPF